MAATFSRRTILSTAAGVALTGCGETNIAQIGKTAALMWNTDKAGYDPQKARDLPYATLDAKLGKTASALLVLGEVDNMEYLHWFSADRAQIITDNLRVLKTAGLPINLTQTAWLPPHQGERSGLRLGGQAKRVIDVSEQNAFGIVIESSIYKITEEKINIFGNEIQTTKYSERNIAKSIGWEFDNIFWQDASGFTWRTEQSITPTNPIIKLQVLKRYK